MLELFHEPFHVLLLDTQTLGDPFLWHIPVKVLFIPFLRGHAGLEEVFSCRDADNLVKARIARSPVGPYAQWRAERGGGYPSTVG